MVRETRHLWVGNLPDNIREDRIREHFKRYGRVQSVKLLPRGVKEETGEMACTVAFMDIKSASKAHTAEHKLDDRTLTTEYYEPAAIPSSSSPPNASAASVAAGYTTTSPSTTRFPNGHSSADEHGNFAERFYDRANNARVPEGDYIRRPGYHDTARGRNRDRGFRNGPYNSSVTGVGVNLMEGVVGGVGGGGGGVVGGAGRHRAIVNNSWPYENTRYNNQANDTGYNNTTPTDTISDRRSEQSTKKTKTKSRSGSRTPSPSGSTSSRSPSRSRSRSSSSSSSSSGSQGTSSTGSPKSRRLQSNNPSHQPVVHTEDRRPLAICVRNLPLRSSDTSLKDGLFHEYKKHGKVTWVKVVGQSAERHAIVCFKKPEDAEKALEVSYDKQFFGCKIEVAPYQGYDVEDNDLRPYEAEIDEFHPKATRTLFIGNLEKDVTASDLRKHFDQFGEIIEIDIKKQGAVSSYAFCQYSDIVSVVKAIRTMDGEHLNNNRIKLGFGKSMPTPCVWVDGVSDSVTDKYLSMQFDPFGIVGSTFVDREKGQALIFFDQVINAQTAVNKMRGVSLRGRKIQVDFASRECQEAFFENLEKQGHVIERPGLDERRDSTSRSFESLSSSRFARYETPTRPRTASYSSRTGAPAVPCNTTAIPSPGTPGSATPRGTSSRSRLTRYEYYEQNPEYQERFRSYDEYSQGSAASHEDGYEHEFVYHESPSHLEPIEARLQTAEHVIIPFVQPDIRNLQKERVLLLEQLEECPSSGDELISPKKRLKLEHLDGTITSDVIIEANRDHRKVTEVRRSSDASLKHLSRRPSVDGKHVTHERGAYLPHAVCKRRKTAGSDSGRVHHYESSESVGGSRPGTPLCDERPEHFTPSEPRRIPREREGPLTLPLPRFASQVMGRGSISIAGIKGQKENVLSSPPPAVTSPRISNPKPPSPTPVPPPASPPPRPPSLSSNSSDSDGASPSPSLDERIKSLDEKYEKWSGSRALSTTSSGLDALAKLDMNRERFKFKHKLLDLDLKELQPSEIVKSVMAKRSVFDEDSKRLENVGEKYEPKDFTLFPRTPVTVQTTVPATTLSTLPLLKVCTNPLPKTPTMLSPRSSGAPLTPAKGLQYPFPTHPPMQPSPSSLVAPPPPPPPPITSSTTTTPPTPTPTQPPASTTPRSAHGENRLKSCATAPSDNWTPSKVSVNRSVSSIVVVSNKTSDANNKNIPPTSECVTPPAQQPEITKSNNNKTNKVSNRRDSATASNTMAAAAASNCESNKSRRNSESSGGGGGGSSSSSIGRRAEDNDNNCDSTEMDRLERARIENERIEKEAAEKERVERERLEKEKQERERLELERMEREERERQERERFERERQERERLERERAAEKERERERMEKERKEREERLRREREDKERREREEKERREREDKERRERDEKERREREDRERREREEQLEREKQQQEKERRDRREREEKEKREREEREKREREELHEKERLLEKERRREKDEERKHSKEDNHDKRNDHSRHRENHSENKHRENSSSVDLRNSTATTNSTTTTTTNVKDDNKKDNHISRKEDSTTRNSHDKNRYLDSRDVERRKESAKENRENNLHEKSKILFNEIREGKDRPPLESHHSSIELDKKDHPSRRKERNNSLPASIGSKRRMSSHDSLDGLDESKKLKLSQEQHHRKISERRDSKDSSKSKHSAVGSSANATVPNKNSVGAGATKSSYDDKNRSSHNHIKESSEERRKEKEREREERHKNKQIKTEKQKIKSKNREKDSRESPSTPKSPAKEPIPATNTTTTTTTLDNKDFLARLDLVEVEKQQQQKQQLQRKEMMLMMIAKEERKSESGECKRQEERRKEHKPLHPQQLPQTPQSQHLHQQLQQHLQQQDQSPNDDAKSSDERKQMKRERIRKFTNSSDNTDSDEPKKHSIFDIVEDEPAYISMYDKVKARSCKNMQKQEEEKRQEKIKAKFSQLKQSRAKREEKKRSTSWDEDSDSDMDREKSDPNRRKNKMLIASSDEDDMEFCKQIKKEMFSDSDSDHHHHHHHHHHHRNRQPKSEESSDEDHIKSLQRKGSKSRITSDTSDEEFNKKSSDKIKTEMFSDNEDQGFADSDEKYKKIKDEFDEKYHMKKKNCISSSSSKFSELNQQIFGGDSSSPEIKEEKFNRRIYDNSSADESVKIEPRKKHKKKQKRQKNSLSSEEGSKLESESMQSDDKSKNSEKRKQHSKKDKKRDKTKDESRSKKSKKSKSECKDFRRDGKMENIFGSLSDDSEGHHKEITESADQKQYERFNEDISQPNYGSDSDSAAHAEQLKEEKDRNKLAEDKERNKAEEKERFLKEEHRKRKEKKRREKEKRLREEQLNNDNSLDYVDLGKQLENNIKDDSNEVIAPANDEIIIKSSNKEAIVEDACRPESNPEDVFKFSEDHPPEPLRKDSDRKENKEKKKKRKKSKDEKQRHHHHHHHHEKNKINRSPPAEITTSKKDEVEEESSTQQPKIEIKTETVVVATPTTSNNVVSAFDIPVIKSSPNLDVSISPQHREPMISPIPKTPTSSKDKKREKFIPGFGGIDIDDKIHENAIKSISEFEAPIATQSPVHHPATEEVAVVEKVEAAEEKPRVVISQEETEDAVAALLGESFGSAQFDDYNEQPSPVNEQSCSAPEENQQDDEEMRQAVQSLNSSELEIKPDTPQSEHELQIDTDTEEQEEISIRYDPPRTPELIDFSQPPKTPDIPSYFRKDSEKNMPSISSPPSLTPIKATAAVIDAKRKLEMTAKKPTELQQQQPRPIIISKSSPWLIPEKKEPVIVTNSSFEPAKQAATISCESKQPKPFEKSKPFEQSIVPPLPKLEQSKIIEPSKISDASPKPFEQTKLFEQGKRSSFDQIQMPKQYEPTKPLTEKQKPHIVEQSVKLKPVSVKSPAAIPAVDVVGGKQIQYDPPQAKTPIEKISFVPNSVASTAYDLHSTKVVQTKPVDVTPKTTTTLDGIKTMVPVSYAQPKLKQLMESTVQIKPVEVIPSRVRIAVSPKSTYEPKKFEATKPQQIITEPPKSIPVDRMPPLTIQTSAIMAQTKLHSPSFTTTASHVKADDKIDKTLPALKPVKVPVVSLHNLPPQMPYPVPSNKEVPKMATSSVVNRLPITPVLVSKPSHPNTHILPQAKTAISQDSIQKAPGVVVATSLHVRPHLERPRMVYQQQQQQFNQNFSQRMVVQRPPGLLITNRQVSPSTYLQQQQQQPPLNVFAMDNKLRPALSTQCSQPPKLVSTAAYTMQKTEPPKLVSASYNNTQQQPISTPSIIISTHHPVVAANTNVLKQQTFMPVIQEAPKLVSITPSAPPQPSIIQTTAAKTQPQVISAVLPKKIIHVHQPTQQPPVKDDRDDLLKVKEVTRTSTPSPVIVQTPKQQQELPDKPKLTEVKIESKPSAIEKATEEMNLKLKDVEDLPIVEKPKPTVEVVEAKTKPIEVVVKDVPKVEAPVLPSVPVETPKVPDMEIVSVIKETDKLFDEEKAETESIISDISKERLSADIKEDALDSKEDSDYWSAKEVNIDSVIKKVDALCSGDELSDRSSEIGKDEWSDDNKIVDAVKMSDDKEPEKLDDSKNEESESMDDANVDEKEVSAVMRGRRGGRRGGRKARGGVERGGMTTRRGGKIAKEVPTAVATRGARGGRTGRPKTTKITKSESEDIYEFRDDSDESLNKDRPRLILTIKSPAITNNANGNATVVKEVVKEIIKEVPLHIPPQTPQVVAVATKLVESKEEFASPANTRKSRRLQERDVSRNTVDDTIEDVVRNTILTRAAAAAAAGQLGTRRSARQIAVKPMPEINRKSPRGGGSGRKKDRRASETTDDSSEEKSPVKNESLKIDTPASTTEPTVKDPVPPLVSDVPKLEVREKPHEGLKAAMLRRVKGEMNQEPMTLIDPVTGLLTPMRECEEGRYIPLASQNQNNAAHLLKVATTTSTSAKLQDSVQTSISVISSSTPQIVVPPATTIVLKQQQKPQSLKAHVLAKAVAAQQVPVSVTPASSTVTTTVAPLVTIASTPTVKPITVNVPANFTPTHVLTLSPRPALQMPPVSNKPIQGVKVIQPPVSPQLHQLQQQKIIQQVVKMMPKAQQHAAPVVVGGAVVNTQMAHVKLPTSAQLTKSPVPVTTMIKPHMVSQPIGVSPPSKQHILTNQQQRMLGKVTMDPPKVEVSIASSCVMVPRSNVSPQAQQQRHVLQAGMPVPPYEASMGEGIAHFTPGSVPTLRASHEMPAHYMQPPHVMYQQYLRQQPYHLPRSPMVLGGLEKSGGDGQEGEEAPVNSPPLELRRPGSVGHALTGRSTVVPHSLQSPHDRVTDSPQVGQVYGMHTSRMQFHQGRYYEPGEPPPAHRPLTSHSSLAALGSERPLGHMGAMGTPDRPLSSHSALASHMGGLGNPDRPLGSHISDRTLTTHLPDRPISSHIPDRSMTHIPDRGLAAVLGAAGNILGAVARHVGPDAPTSQRGLQAATPPHASQVPPQAESLLMLLKHYPCMWQGLLALKNDQAAVQMYFVSGNESVAKMSLPKNTDGSTPPLRIFQRMRLEPPQVEGVARKMQMENEHCMLLALPCGHDHMDVLKQSTNLTTGFITYLQQKQAAGIVNVAAPGTTQPPAYVVHIFPSCDFVNENLRRIAPSLLERVADIAHLLIVITTV